MDFVYAYVFFLKKIYFAWFLFAFLALFWFVFELDGWRHEEGLREEMREEKLIITHCIKIYFH